MSSAGGGHATPKKMEDLSNYEVCLSDLSMEVNAKLNSLQKIKECLEPLSKLIEPSNKLIYETLSKNNRGSVPQ